jgi:dethiobiotin synthetase
MARVLFITGSDTGVGKTVLTVLLTRHLRRQGTPVLALKPICSGGRDDAEALRAAQGGGISLDAINPWSFRAPVAPWLAARREGRPLEMGPVVAFLRAAMETRPRSVVLIEGAGGLLSPLGERFANRELLVAVRADPLVVCANRLGALNQVLLVLEALPPAFRGRARVVLTEPVAPDDGSRTNAAALGERLGPGRVVTLPRFLKTPPREPGIRVRRLLDQLLGAAVAETGLPGACRRSGGDGV